MKKLFAIALVASVFSGLYGLSFGLGGQYVLEYPGAMPDSTFSYPGVVADVMCKPLPILGFRIGLVQVNLWPEDEGNTNFHIGTGVDATVLVYIPMAAPISPYIPLGVFYHGYDGLSMMNLKGGVGAEMGFGSLAGYLEGGIHFSQVSPEGVDSSSDNWFYVQGGIRVPVGL
jgi:hypothetical protein